MNSKIALTGNSSLDPQDPNYDGADSEDSGLQECEQKIDDLETRVAALEAKAGIGGSPASSAPASPASKAPASGFYGG
jgi:hypothetical protein